MQDAERKNWENRFLRDDISYREKGRITGCVYEDFDTSGQKDLCLLTVSETEASTILYFYMNDAPVYAVTIPEVNCWSVEVTCGDVDHDGNTELIYLANTGGNDGSFFDKNHTTGNIIGANGRGYYSFEIVTIDGLEYLSAEEYFYGEAGGNDAKGYARFLFDWDESGNWLAKEFEAVAYPY